MTDSNYVRDVSGNAFQAQVIEKSRDVLVLVDFWAPWCGPCRALAPVLQRLADSYAGKLLVAKVNTDVEQALAVQYQIRGIPAVKLFRNGGVVGEFVGVQPESVIKSLIDRFIPDEVDELIQKSSTLLNDGDSAQAEALLRGALARETPDDRVKLELAKLLGDDPTANGARIKEARALLDSLSPASAEGTAIAALKVRLDLLDAALKAPPSPDLERAIEATPGDSMARYQLAARLFVTGDYGSAMDQLLDIVRRDRTFRDDIARTTLVGIFQVLGQQHPLSIKYRTQLARALN